MAKFMVLYNSDQAAAVLMANAIPQEMKASMEEWMVWRDEVVKTLGFEFGMPLQPIDRVTPEGTTASECSVSGYAIMEGEKTAVVAALKTHPHLKRDGGTIDVLEMLAMPGMQR